MFEGYPLSPNTCTCTHTLSLPPYQNWEEWKQFPLWWKGPSDRDDNKGLGRLCLEKLPLSSRLPPPPSPLLSSLIFPSLYLPLPSATLSGRAPLSPSLGWRYNRGDWIKNQCASLSKGAQDGALWCLFANLKFICCHTSFYSPLLFFFGSFFSCTHVLCENVNGRRCKSRSHSCLSFIFHVSTSFGGREEIMNHLICFDWSRRDGSAEVRWDDSVEDRESSEEKKEGGETGVYTLMTLQKLCAKTKLSALSEN